MAAAVYATDLTDIFTDGDTTNWTGLGGGNAGLNQELDYFIQGTSCLSKNAWSGATKGMSYAAGATTIAAGDVLFIWMTHQTANSLDTETNGGLRILIGSDSSNYYEYYVSGSDVIVYDDRWVCFVIDPRTGTVAADVTTGSPTATKAEFGGLAAMVGGPSKGAPFAIDAIRHGRALTVTAGDITNGYATFDGAATYQDNVTRRWGQFQKSGGVYKMQGLFQMGSAATAVDFRDANRSIFIARTTKVAASFNEFEILNTGSRVDWANITIQALDTTSKGKLTVTDNADVNIDTCTFVDMDTFLFKALSAALNCTWRGCGIITANSADLSGSSIEGYEGTANTSPLIWDTAVDPDGKLDNMAFSMGTALTHAIEFGTTSPTTMTLRGIDFVGYNALNGQNDSTFHVKRTSGTVTINIIGGSGNVSYRTDGATVSIVQNPVSLTLTVTDAATGSKIQNARAYVEADAIGPLPYQDSVTITRVTTTATVAHTGHGLANGNKVLIEGADQAEYNGIKTISNVSANAYDYTVSGTPVTPATGTITSTAVILEGLTDINGQISDTRTYASNQDFTGRVRKSSASPYYRTSKVTGTIDSNNGLSVTIGMISDE